MHTTKTENQVTPRGRSSWGHYTVDFAWLHPIQFGIHQRDFYFFKLALWHPPRGLKNKIKKKGAAMPLEATGGNLILLTNICFFSYSINMV